MRFKSCMRHCGLSHLFSDIRTVLILQFGFVLKTINKAFENAETLKRKFLRRYTREYEGYLSDKVSV